MFFPKPAPSAMTPYLMCPFHERHLEVGLAPWNGASSLLATFYVEPFETRETHRFIFTGRFQMEEVDAV